MKKRMRKKKQTTARRKKAKKVTATHSAPHQFDNVNGAKYIKNKVLVFKLRKQLNTEMAQDAREIKQLTYLTKRARKIAA